MDDSNRFSPSIQEAVNKFLTLRDVNHRNASFDYCYNYFQTTPCYTDDMEKSCMVLGFYLASWGMFRGSSFLLQRSARYFIPFIEYIEELDHSVWGIDADTYNHSNIEQILEVYKKTVKIMIPGKQQAITLTTKILLGVFGFVPAYDNYFCDTFRSMYSGRCAFRSFNKKSPPKSQKAGTIINSKIFVVINKLSLIT
ncbi:MAG: hypothetical protein WC155_06240 [Candidatus Cloacimonadales bacterium]|nr:hypothetical protein [Bacteroidales bacterium]